MHLSEANPDTFFTGISHQDELPKFRKTDKEFLQGLKGIFAFIRRPEFDFLFCKIVERSGDQSIVFDDFAEKAGQTEDAANVLDHVGSGEGLDGPHLVLVIEMPSGCRVCV
jgi:hypothetical protein